MSSDPRKSPTSTTVGQPTLGPGSAPVSGWQALPVRLANGIWGKIFPFLRWFPIATNILRADVVAGMIGALVLVPKAMAYAQLSGLPVYFGLYAAFIPAIIGALWGSSRQLLTGPVAVISLMTASALAPFALAGTDQYIALALLLALLVGVVQIGMGAFKLGVIVNFISHPVIIGFINAAAIIIALSQLNKLLGIPLGRSDSFLVRHLGDAPPDWRHPPADPGDGPAGLRHHVGDEEVHTRKHRPHQRARGSGGHHPGQLGGRLRAQHQG